MHDHAAVDQWRARLALELGRRGQRVTKQRALVVDALLATEGHVNIDELHQRVRKWDPGVGYATVYRTVKLLEECALVHSAQFGDGTTRYEAAVGGDAHHDHLICTHCGRIIEFENAEIEALQLTVASQHRFRMQHHKMEIYGLCEACQQVVVGAEITAAGPPRGLPPRGARARSPSRPRSTPRSAAAAEP